MPNCLEHCSVPFLPTVLLFIYFFKTNLSLKAKSKHPFEVSTKYTETKLDTVDNRNEIGAPLYVTYNVSVRLRTEQKNYDTIQTCNTAVKRNI